MTAACLHGRKEVVQYVLEEGADIGATNSKSFSPLLCAVKAGKWEIADTLLLAGADIEQTDKYGRTPLMIAASEGHLTVLDMLVSKAFVLVCVLKLRMLIHVMSDLNITLCPCVIA